MRLRIIILTFVTYGFLMSSCVAQNHGIYATDSKKAVKFFKSALDFYKIGKKDIAVDYLNKALKKDSNFVDAYLLLGDIYSSKNDLESAIAFYNKALEKDADYYPKANYMAAVLEQKTGHFADAAAHLRTYLQSPYFDESLRRRVNAMIDQCDFAVKLMEHPVAYEPKNLGPNINSEDYEFVNSVNTENDMIIFTVQKRKREEGRDAEDFYFSHKDRSGTWQPRQMLGSNFNTRADEGAMSISPDGKLIVFASNRQGGYGRYDLYYSVKQGGKWSKPKNMGAGVNTEYWESMPSISSDGKRIYFVSDRRGGLGGSDIYYVTLRDDGTYGNPVNLGYNINSRGNEMSPFIHQDGHTLYFVSNGRLGMGGTDIFYSRMNDDGTFGEAVNMGYPINSTGNEKGLLVDAKGTLAYISSDKKGGYGFYDIYNFKLYKEARPMPVTYLKGVVYDKTNKQRLQVDFDLIDLKTGKVWIHSHSDAVNGEFLVCIPSGKNFALNAYRRGYLFYSENFHLDSTASIEKPFIKNVPMTPLKAGESIVLRNVFFATNSYDLRPESETELNKLFDLLVKNPTLKVEISGHTDNVGSDTKNMTLSENRAKSVYNYLINKGINASRLSYAGYGESKPVATNDTEEGRQQNRRTEVKIVSL